MLWPVVKALLGHYRRYPLQIILVWLGLTLGVSLLVGVTSINSMQNKVMQLGGKNFSPILCHTESERSTLPIKFLKVSIFSYVELGSTNVHRLTCFI